MNILRTISFHQFLSSITWPPTLPGRSGSRVFPCSQPAGVQVRWWGGVNGDESRLTSWQVFLLPNWVMAWNIVLPIRLIAVDVVHFLPFSWQSLAHRWVPTSEKPVFLSFAYVGGTFGTIVTYPVSSFHLVGNIWRNILRCSKLSRFRISSTCEIFFRCAAWSSSTWAGRPSSTSPPASPSSGWSFGRSRPRSCSSTSPTNFPLIRADLCTHHQICSKHLTSTNDLTWTKDPKCTNQLTFNNQDLAAWSTFHYFHPGAGFRAAGRESVHFSWGEGIHHCS